MRERILAGGRKPEVAGATPKLEPAQSGAPHTNSLGMTLIPLPGAPETQRLLLAEAEVTSGQYESYLKATGQRWQQKPTHVASPEHPASGLTWRDAQAFCEWLTQQQRSAGLIPESARYRLPTDLEWSAAAGLTGETGALPDQRDLAVTNHYPWTPSGAWPPPLRAANVEASKLPGFSDPHAYTGPVKSGEPNALGFYELGGNVSEWCQDPWPANPTERVYRGGSWLSSTSDELLSSRRYHAPAEGARDQVGFRCVLDLGPAPSK
jgi:formylglycine-generating enzyme required for sulfatase activity